MCREAHYLFKCGHISGMIEICPKETRIDPTSIESKYCTSSTQATGQLQIIEVPINQDCVNCYRSPAIPDRTELTQEDYQSWMDKKPVHEDEEKYWARPSSKKYLDWCKTRMAATLKLVHQERLLAAEGYSLPESSFEPETMTEDHNLNSAASLETQSGSPRLQQGTINPVGHFDPMDVDDELKWELRSN